jgi:anti-sigma B factor antagonist
MSLEISHKEVAPGVVLVTLAGKLMLGSDGADIPDIVDGFLREGKKIVIFDLSGVTTIDSTGIGRFIASFNKIVNAGGEMRMAGATGHLFQSFHISLLDQVFPFFDTAEDAVRG